MKTASDFALHPGWRLLLKDVGIDPARVLRRAGLPGDLFSRAQAWIKPQEYFALWRAIERESGGSIVPLEIGRAISGESFDAPIFAALCSPDLNTASRRLSRYKRLIGPIALHVKSTAETTTLEFEWLYKDEDPPPVLVAVELVFFVALARLATRESIVPISVMTPSLPEPAAAYEEYFGSSVELGSANQVTFSAEDASRPFLTANEAMWEFFQPELRRRLSELERNASMSDRVRSALLELLPSGDASLRAVSRKLALSTRTLQRRLQGEAVSFQVVLDATREDLARHYLTHSDLSGAEISFLLGFEDPNSFFRAFHGWTGQTPEAMRSAARVH